MLEIRAIMNSPVEDILGFKTCCGLRAFDQNLEIHVKNRGDRPVIVPSHFDLKGQAGEHRVANLMPHGDQRIEPEEIKAFYCSMDETQWKAARQMVFYDTEGNSYQVDIDHQKMEKT
jgi:hypothetical protein